MGTSAAREMGLQAPLSELSSYLWPWAPLCWEPQVMCSIPPASSSFSGAAGSAAVARGPGLQAPPPQFPWFHIIYVFTHPSLDVQMCLNSLVSWCAGKRHLCCVVDILLVVAEGEGKR